MATQTTRWSPDTCGCVVDYQWDDSVPVNQRSHTIVNVVKYCAAHSGKSVPQIHAILFEENPRKNKLMELVKITHPELTTTTTLDSGDTAIVFKKGNAPSWNFDSNRVLNLTVPGLNSHDKAILQSDADSQIGNGKVKIL